MVQAIPITRNTTPDTLCHALKNVAERSASFHLVARPYNPFEPDTTTWWLVPSSDFPARRFGKYSVRWRDRADLTIFAGLEVEKGVGPTAAPAFKSPKGRRLVMTDDWEWFHFLRTIHTGEFHDALVCAAQSVQTEVLVRVSLGMINDPESFDPDAPSLPRGSWTFVWDFAKRSIRCQESKGATKLAPLMEQATTIQHLVHEIENAENRDWLWGKVVPCVTLRADVNDGALLMSEQHLWACFLSHLRPWVRTA